jgi:hypothetical protein
MASSLHTLERRILALESRLADVEGGHGETLYQLRRESVRNRLSVAKIMSAMNIPEISEEAVDAELDEA